MALVVENTGVRVFSSKGLVRARSAKPAQRSTTSSPASTRAKRAPSSWPVVKLSAKAARAPAKRSGQNP